MTACIFDLGGVVFRWRPAVLIAGVLPRHAVDRATTQGLVEQFFQHDTGDWGEFDRGTMDVPELAQRIARRTGVGVEDVLRVIDAVPRELEPLPPTLALIDELRRAGHRLFFLSNMPAPYAEHLERSHPLSDWFEDGVFSSRVSLIKPEPAIYRHALQRFAVRAADCVFFDDYPVNIAAANAQGLHGLLFSHARQARAELAGLGVLQ